MEIVDRNMDKLDQIAHHLTSLGGGSKKVERVGDDLAVGDTRQDGLASMVISEVDGAYEFRAADPDGPQKNTTDAVETCGHTDPKYVAMEATQFYVREVLGG